MTEKTGGVEAAIQRWQAELLDLSKANQLLYFKEGRALKLTHPVPTALFDGLVSSIQTYRLYRPDDDDGAEDTEQLSLVLSESEQNSGALEPVEPHVARPPRPDEIVPSGEAKKIQAALYRYRLRSRSMLLEQGVNVLYVAFGMLDWAETAASDVRILSPLLLVPVRLDRETALDPFEIIPLDEPPVFNPALAFKMNRDFHLGLSIPESDEAGDVSLQTILGHVKGAISGRRDWKVVDGAHLGLFWFAKQAMYADLATNRNRFAMHAIIRSVAGEENGLPESFPDLPRAEELDDRLSPADVFQVLDADASQQEAIGAVNAGASLVIQGPPGTGKSQTITNVIAESLARGKTVLFVSEKIAALNVVEKRLIGSGLSDFCLKAHSQDLDKAAVVHELAAALSGDGRAVRDGSGAHELAQLELLRTQLNSYARDLHAARNPLGRSAYQIHGEVAQRTHIPVITFDLPDMGELSPARLAELTDVARRLESVGDVLLEAREHPWAGCTLKAVTPLVRATLDESLQRLADRADWLGGLQMELRGTWGLGPHGSLDAARWLGQLLPVLEGRPDVPSMWLRSESLAPALTTAHEYRQRMEAYTTRRAAVLERYDAHLLTVDLERLSRDLRDGGLPSSGRIVGVGEPADRAVSQQTAINAAVSRVTGALRAALRIGADVAPRLGLPAPESLNQVRRLRSIAELVSRDPRPERSWFETGRLSALEELAGASSELQKTVDVNRAALKQLFEDEIFDLTSPELAARFEEAYASWTRVFRPHYHRDLGRIKRLLKEPTGFGYDDAIKVLRQARRLAAAQTGLEQQRDLLIVDFGRHFASARTDWAAVKEALALVGLLIATIDGATPIAVIDLLLGEHGGMSAFRPLASALSEATVEAEGALGQLRSLVSLADLPFSPVGAEDAPAAELSSWLEGWERDLTILWSAVGTVIQYRIAGSTPVADLLDEVEEAAAVVQQERDLLAASQDLEATFGHLFHGLDTRWDVILEALAWAGNLRDLFGGDLPRGTFVDAVVRETATPPGLAQRLSLLIDEVGHSIEGLASLFEPADYRIGGQAFNQATLTDVGGWAREKRAALSRLEDWTDFAQARSRAHEYGLDQFIDGLQAVRPPRETWREVLLRQVYVLWLTWRYGETPSLATFRGQRHEDLVTQFARLDEKQWRTASLRIAARLLPKRPRAGTNVHPRSEPAILLHEAIKKKRFRPLRKLFADLPNLLPALKPCMLMSPLAVAQFLGESPVAFDVVVFDEASQILPADAIGAIGRGHQVVVVGDQQQLPPTRFFAAGTQFLEEGTDEELPESILDACLAAGLPRKPLLWHYRSQHEHLIAFSNKYFYHHQLITFPSPREDERAVEFVYVPDGVYDRASQRVNRVEATRLVDLLVAYAEENPEHSLGVITFSESQMVAILTEIDARKRERPDLEGLLSEKGAEGFFVKNLENVQGDERDVIFFSVGYGPDQARNMTMNFGPLNREGGERRLNVAVTRARIHVKILASFHPSDIDLTRTQAQGVMLLREYLKFAEQGPAALLGEITA